MALLRRSYSRLVGSMAPIRSLLEAMTRLLDVAKACQGHPSLLAQYVSSWSLGTEQSKQDAAGMMPAGRENEEVAKLRDVVTVRDTL